LSMNNNSNNKVEVSYAETISDTDKQNLSNSYNEFYEQYSKSVVTVIRYIYSGTGTKADSFGSGFCYGQQKMSNGFFRSDDYYLIMTNNHVVFDESSTAKSITAKITVCTYDGLEINASLVGNDEVQDCAVLKILKSDVPYEMEELQLCNNPEVGEICAAIGTPISLSYKATITFGIVSGINRNPVEENFNIFNQSHCIQTDCAINGGNSGGPLLNMNGEVIGVNTFKLVDSIGLNFAMNIHDMKIIADKIVNSGNDSVKVRCCISNNAYYASVKDLSIVERTNLGYGNLYKGVVLEGEDSLLNLNKYSVIKSIDGIEMDDVIKFRSYLYECRKDQNVQLEVYKFINGKLSKDISNIQTQIIEIAVAGGEN